MNNIETMTVEERDVLVERGNQAEQLIKNVALQSFINRYKYECCEELASMTGYTPEHDTKRIAIANKLAGLEDFTQSLRGAVRMKDLVVNRKIPQ
jgi:hypothetical protein